MITFQIASGGAMPSIRKREVSAWIRKVASNYGRVVGDIGYLFVDDATILEYNKKYLGRDYHTDIITFDYDNSNVINGDIVISLDTVRANAERFKVSYDEEIHRVIIHGILHLCGINDETPDDFVIMKDEENKALSIRNSMKLNQ